MIMSFVFDSFFVFVLITITCFFSLEGCKRMKEGRKKGRKETRTPFNSNFILGLNAYSVA